MSSALTKLDRRLIPFAERLVQIARDVGLSPVITSTRRSRVLQARLYRSWLRGERSLPAAAPGTSLHEHGLAIDLVVNDPDAYRELGALWQRWGGEWGGESDPVHFQARGLL
ncbi:MAG TPA: D-alanyl-D-alanine carboxypeptidase family protein [Gemmatimonadales bacterium]|nr:D-alanyl-D-alanine carboxypeptidase family protein [Gemmatimonadales bacterium]